MMTPDHGRRTQTNAIYLPGIDTLTLALDGSVRYYGQCKPALLAKIFGRS